jgi:dihydrolipoamide dehydrogenase
LTGTYDILVLGSGPAGFYTALCCAKGGLKTAIVEQGDPGGTGFASGCLPVKMILDKIIGVKNNEPLLTHTFPHINKNQLYGQILKSMQNHRDTVKRGEMERLSEAGVDFYQSSGRFVDKNHYQISSGEIYASRIIIATGSEAASFPEVDFSANVISHSEAVTLENIPEKLLIIGGDVEGIEFASIFSHLGTRVTILEQLSSILPGYDQDLVEPVQNMLSSMDVRICCSRKVLEIQESNETITIKTNKGKFESDMVLVTGFRKASFPCGLEAAGVKRTADRIIVNQNYETSVPGIYAVGDINGILGMAGTAIQQAVHLSDYLISRKEIDQDYTLLPRAVFTIPSICGGGLQEKDFLNLDETFSVNRFPLNRTWRSLDMEKDRGFVKIISDSNNIIRGIWFVTEKADTHGAAIGLILRQKLTLEQIKRELYVHPTIFESLFEAGI